MSVCKVLGILVHYEQTVRAARAAPGPAWESMPTEAAAPQPVRSEAAGRYTPSTSTMREVSAAASVHWAASTAAAAAGLRGSALTGCARA